jgi:type VI secretion system protein ImpF
VPDPTTQVQSRREAVQPSLWDRLVDDLPGLMTDFAAREADIEKAIGAEGLELVRTGGLRALEARQEVDDDLRRAVFAYVQQMERRAFLEDRGIVVTQDVLREAVRRDIETLFNTERLEARHLLSDSERARAEDPADLMADFPHVRRSVLNYGVPSFSGRRARDFDPEQLARELKEVVAVFEPRLKRDTIRIKVDTRDKAGMKIEIEGLLMLAPVPERLKLATMIDLDSGRAATNIEDG